MNKKAIRVRVWDLPTRVFHWLFALSFAIAFISSGDARYLDTHIFAAYVFGTLLVFRIIWGLIGTDYAKFSNFAYSPKTAIKYIRNLFRNKARPFVGHNPAGSLAIFLMLMTAAAIVISGMIVFAGIEQKGLLFPYVSMSTGTAYQSVHEFFAWMMLVVIIVHVVGVLIESGMHHENLIKAMIGGYKYSARGMSSVPLYGWVAVAIMFSVTSYAIVTYKGYLQETEGSPYLPYQPVSLPQSDQWNDECGECHIPFHPSLLPQRSWITMFKQQENHFGDDLMLEGQVVTDLLAFAMRNSSERHKTEAAWFIDRTMPLNQNLIRITDTSYWKEQHSRIDNRYWKSEQVSSKSQCDACHYDAKQGSFEDGAMRLPKLENKKAIRVASVGQVYKSRGKL